MALRASVASTRPERLLALLEMWAESPLPLPGRTLPEPFAHAWALVEKGEGPV
ncbi:hypothetical protein ACFW95_06450 [Streptomyces sp. NPDC059474]|uniref:hypothetical protein n=1 Tax=Streptomyces sp. NPDC059474 TaxID=3346846 RepID=UPI0036939AE6